MEKGLAAVHAATVQSTAVTWAREVETANGVWACFSKAKVEAKGTLVGVSEIRSG